MALEKFTDKLHRSRRRSRDVSKMLTKDLTSPSKDHRPIFM